MIQRVQSLWLLLAGLAMLGVFFLPFYKYSDGESLAIANRFFLILAAGGSILLSVVAIFLFKNRKWQLKLGWMNLLLCLLLLILMYFAIMASEKSSGVTSLNPTQGYYWVGAFLPVVSLISIALAARGIRKDEKLIRESNRLR